MLAEDSRVRAAYKAAVTARGKKAHQDLAQVPRNLEDAHRDKGVSRATMMNIIRSSPTLQRCDERGIASLCKWVKFVAFPRHYRIMEQGASGDTADTSFAWAPRRCKRQDASRWTWNSAPAQAPRPCP